ncbi:hypothetical protein OA46_14515 [Enterobacter cloacae]|nr:hypothetical protein OA46_14515 [Enterobacter cloacae]
MSTNLLQLCYEGESGESYIRSFNEKGHLYISFTDVLKTLSIENRKMDRKTPQSLLPVMKAVSKTLDSDEIKNIDLIEDDQPKSEAFLTEPGLYRVLAQDTSAAGKKFQRWLFHKVLPSIREHGVYPPPVTNGKSDIREYAEKLQQAVNLWVMEIAKREELEGRVNDVELKVNALENLRDISGFSSIPKRLLELGLEGLSVQELWGWCEKLRSERDAERIKCPSGIHINTMYPLALIDEAIVIYQQILEDRTRH